MASQGPRATTASICSSETERGTHSFHISGYSRHIGLGVGRHICSIRFTIGGHEWRIRYYPDGANDGCQDFIAVHLELVSELTSEVRLEYDFKLLRNQATSESPYQSIFRSPPQKHVFTAKSSSSTCENNEAINKEELIDKYLWDDCIEIKCYVTVIKESRLRETAIRPDIFHVQVPPSNLSDDLFEWFKSKREVDFKFKVKDKDFHVHKLVLAMRSQVFKAELGQARDKRTDTFIIEGMEPAVFEALLHFIYTDKLLKKDNENEEMVKNLFAAADRYKMQRLKLLCGNILSKRLTVQSVTDTIALAEKHQCRELKDACIQFTISSKRIMTDVLSSEGFKKLKGDYPAVALDMVQNSDMFKVTITRPVSEEGPTYDDIDQAWKGVYPPPLNAPEYD